MFTIKNLCKSFYANDNKQTVLDSISFNIAPKSFTAISGASGSGKSTLVSILSGLEQADTGSVIYKGTELGALNQSQLAKLRNQKFGFIFQSPFYIPYKNLIENIMLPLNYSNKTRDINTKEGKALKDWALALTDMVGLSTHLYKSPALLSGGEQQRMAFARALILKPEVIFADEPTASLDHKNAEIILNLLDLQVKDGKSVILVSHDKQAIEHATTVFELQKKGQSIVQR